MGHQQSCHGLFWNLLVMLLVITSLSKSSFGDVRRDTAFNLGGSVADNTTSNYTATTPTRNSIPDRFSSGDFPMCTASEGPYIPFCLPEDGADVFVDTTYYVTWNADFYPMNATITIELRYSDTPEGSSAFTSERIDNSYGYIPLHMRKEWLQGKTNSKLTLYIIELDPTSDQRASARRGPTVTLIPKPVEHYKPSPPKPFNKQALYIGLPVSLVVVFAVVAGLVFGMRSTREAMIRKIRRSRSRGYGVRKSRTQRVGNDRKESTDSDESAVLNRHVNDVETGLLGGTGSDRYNNDLESSAFRRDASRLKSWMNI